MRKIVSWFVVMFVVLSLGLAAVAATIDVSVGGYASPGNSKSFSVSKTLDFTSAYVGTNANVYQMVKVPAGTLVQAVYYETTFAYQTRSGTNYSDAYTFDIGDGTDTNLWGNDINGSNATGCAMFSVLDSATNLTYTAPIQKYYSADDTIDVKLNAGVTNANITIRYEGIMLK